MSMNDYSLDSSLSCLLQVFISGGNMADIKQKR